MKKQRAFFHVRERTFSRGGRKMSKGKKRIVFSVLLAAAVSFAGCGGSDTRCSVVDNQDGTATITCPDGSSVTVGTGADRSVLVDAEAVGAGDENCPNGGVVVYTGVDSNGNGVLDPSERANSEYVCNGEPAKSPLVVNEALDTGDPNCPNGGYAVHVGIDADGSGTLEGEEITDTLYVCNGRDGQGSTPSGVLQGSYTIANSLDVYFLSAITEITGDLVIHAPGLSEVSLPALKKVDGSLVVHDNNLLATIDMPALEEVGGIFELYGNDALAEFSLPPALARLGGLYVHDSDALTRLSTAPSASVLSAGCVSIRNNPSLTEISLPAISSVGSESCPDGVHGFFVQNNSSLATISLDSLSSVQGSVEIFGNPALTGLSLPALATVGNTNPDDGAGYLQILNNESLATISLESLSSVEGSVKIYSNPALTGILLPALNTIGKREYSQDTLGMIIYNNDNLATISLGSLSSVEGSVKIYNNPALTGISLPALATVGNTNPDDPAANILICKNDSLTTIFATSLSSVEGKIIIGGGDNDYSSECHSEAGNPALTSISFPSLRTVGKDLLGQGIKISYNDSLTTISADSLLSVEGSVSIDSNPALTGLSLPVLATAGWLGVSSNPALTGISLPALTTVGNTNPDDGDGYLQISNNESLSTISANSLTSVEGTVLINSNYALRGISFHLLGSIGESLYVGYNITLSSIDFSSLTSLGDRLEFTYNPALCRSLIDALVTQLQSNGWSGSTYISGNDNSC
ncbi:MAG: hypothetical protein D6806_16820 [Deltaproteobacteria bacterium]|nr:MAG: hypothetical protein D6806_16820 [Deltaproteobacteria bacterium]